MSQKSEDKAKNASKREAINNTQKPYVAKNNETRRDTEYAEGQPWSKENLEKVAKDKAKSQEKAKRNESYYELLRRDKTATDYRKHEQNKKKMSPMGKSIDDWTAINFGTYNSKEKRIKDMAASMAKKGTKTGIKNLKKYENMHTLTPEERDTLHKAYGLKRVSTQDNLDKNIKEHKEPEWSKLKSPSRKTQYESHQATQRANLVHEAQIHKDKKKHTDVNFKYAGYGIGERKPSTRKPDVNATTGTRDTKSYVLGDKDSKYYANNNTRDYNYPTSIPKPPTTKNDEKKPSVTPKKKTTKKSGGNKGGSNTSIKNRTPEQLLNDVTGVKSSKGKTGATHKEGSKADYKSREEYEKYYKQQDKLKGGKK